jgi:hypothetical protein
MGREGEEWRRSQRRPIRMCMRARRRVQCECNRCVWLLPPFPLPDILCVGVCCFGDSSDLKE